MKPLREFQPTSVQLAQTKLAGVTVTESQVGLSVAWSFDFASGMRRVEKDGTAYLIGYLSHDEAMQLAAFLTREEF
jgi:hypothetical protein